jgi:hypothetical protein
VLALIPVADSLRALLRVTIAISDVEAYTEWMKGFLTPVPDGRYEVR